MFGGAESPRGRTPRDTGPRRKTYPANGFRCCNALMPLTTPDYVIHPIPLPTPFPVGDVNVYLIRAERWVLIDTGLDWEKDRRALLQGMAAAGVAPEQIAEVLLTHTHIDHCGQAGWIQERSGAPVRAHPADAPRLTGFPDAYHAMLARYRDHSARMGFPVELFDAGIAAFGKAMMLMRSARVEKTIDEGDRIPLGGTHLEVIHTPGHTPGSVCFYDRKNRILFAGDTVLKHITPNPFFGGHTHRRAMGTGSYLRSLDRLVTYDVRLSLNGHGEAVEDLREVVERVRAHSRARSEKLLGLVATGKPTHPFELSRRLFGELPLTDVWLAFAETLGHLEALEEAGRIREIDGGAHTRFAVREA